MKNTRIQLEMSEARVRELDAVMEQCDIKTRKELFNNALTILEWAVGETLRGNEIAAINRNEKEFYALHMPILSNISARKLHTD